MKGPTTRGKRGVGVAENGGGPRTMKKEKTKIKIRISRRKKGWGNKGGSLKRETSGQKVLRLGADAGSNSTLFSQKKEGRYAGGEKKRATCLERGENKGKRKIVGGEN